LGRVAVQARFIWRVAKNHHSACECPIDPFSFSVVALDQCELGKHRVGREAGNIAPHFFDYSY